MNRATGEGPEPMTDILSKPHTDPPKAEDPDPDHARLHHFMAYWRTHRDWILAQHGLTLGDVLAAMDAG